MEHYAAKRGEVHRRRWTPEIMGTQLTGRQTLIALAIGMVALLATFYIPMIVWGGQRDILEWLLPAILIVSVFVFLPLGAIIVNMLGQLVVLPFLAIFALVEWMKRKQEERK